MLSYDYTMIGYDYNPLGSDLKCKMDRRSFLTAATVGALGLTSIAGKAGLRNPGKIALQLYTVRREIETNLFGTLEKVAGIGFKNVETAFWPENISLKQAADALKSMGLEVCSIHCELPLGVQRHRMLEFAEAYQCDTLIWHGWPEDPRYSTLEGIKQLADVYNEANQFASSNGLKFGLHNHWWEFRNNINGQYPYQVLEPRLEEGIFFELDTYWIKVAGLEPAQIVRKFGQKAPLLHIKDGPARYTDSLGKDEPEPMTAVGQGVQDFPEIVKAADGHTRWMIVEMDRTSADVFKALEDSYRYLVDNNLAIK